MTSSYWLDIGGMMNLTDHVLWLHLANEAMDTCNGLTVLVAFKRKQV